VAQPRVTDFLLGDDDDFVVRNGDFAMATDKVGIKQSIDIRLSFVRGEWFLDESIGIPYYEVIFVKNPSLVVVREVFREALDDTPGVLEILALDVGYDGNRIASVPWIVSTDLGELSAVSNQAVI
jgi:hypothetical protein